MTITADAAHDNLSIVGGDGFITVESIVKATDPDTIYIDCDLATSSGLAISGKQLYAVVDNSTVFINGSGQLYAVGGSGSLSGLSDVSISGAVSGDALAYNTTFWEWQNQDMDLTGSTSQATGTDFNAYQTASTSVASAASNSHTHSANFLQEASSGTHTHDLDDGKEIITSAGPSSTQFAITNMGGPQATRSVARSIAVSKNYVARDVHTHPAGSLNLVIS